MEHRVTVFFMNFRQDSPCTHSLESLNKDEGEEEEAIEDDSEHLEIPKTSLSTAAKR